MIETLRSPQRMFSATPLKSPLLKKKLTTLVILKSYGTVSYRSVEWMRVGKGCNPSTGVPKLFVAPLTKDPKIVAFFLQLMANNMWHTKYDISNTTVDIVYIVQLFRLPTELGKKR
jgi:hypothetical protein